jgi:hypothetical protein
VKLLRNATIEEVLEVVPDGDDVVRRFAPYTLWLFNLDDVGDVHVQLHNEEAPTRPIRETIDLWLEASLGEGKEALDDRTAYEKLTRDLLADGQFQDPPVIRTQPIRLRKWVTNGAHRFIAAFDLGRADKLRAHFEDARILGTDSLVRALGVRLVP